MPPDRSSAVALTSLSEATVDPDAAVPVWQQVVRAVRRAVVTGELSPGDAVPSVRRFAKQLGVNPLTVNKAYRELQQEGILRGEQGLGSFVAERAEDRSRQDADSRVGTAAEELVIACLQAGESREEAERALRQAAARLGLA